MLPGPFTVFCKVPVSILAVGVEGGEEEEYLLYTLTYGGKIY